MTNTANNTLNRISAILSDGELNESSPERIVSDISAAMADHEDAALALLTRPMSVKDALANADENGFITATVKVDLLDILLAGTDDDYNYYDMLGERIVEGLAPMEVGFEIVGTDPEIVNLLLVRVTYNIVEAAEASGYTDEMYCAECGEAMAIDETGVANHVTTDGGIDHDADADHVALDDSQVG